VGGRRCDGWGVRNAMSVAAGLFVLPEEFSEGWRECLGGVGGRSGPLLILRDCGLRVRGLDGCFPLPETEVLVASSCLIKGLGTRVGNSEVLSDRGRGRTLCFLNCN